VRVKRIIEEWKARPLAACGVRKPSMTDLERRSMVFGVDFMTKFRMTTDPW
jgi:hypothetical protein